MNNIKKCRYMNVSSNDCTLTQTELETGCRLGIDSHADVSCSGKHARILEVYHGKVCKVQPFNDSYNPMDNVRIVNTALAYDTEEGKTYILNLNQSLDFTETMEHCLLCPNQARSNGVVVDDCPKALDYFGRSTHSIYFPEKDINCPLLMHGPISFLPVRYPTDAELSECLHIDLTDIEDWDPSIFDEYGTRSIKSIDSYVLNKPNLGSILEQRVHIINAISHSAGEEVNAFKLSRLWNISLDAARRTLQSTSQQYIRQLNGNISRRVKTRAHQRQYKQLGGYLSKFYADTFKANVPSTRGNKYIHLFANHGNYVCGYPSVSKSDAHVALDGFLHDTGIPSEITTDGAKELHLSEWGTTCRRHKIHQNLTEPHSPWQNHAEITGGVIKRKVRFEMKRTLTPIRLWDYCWAYVCSLRCLTAINNIHLDNGTPFQAVHGYSPDISEFLTFKWFQWVWYHDPKSPEKELLGRWLGPAHSVGQGLAYHVLSDKGQVKVRSTVSPIDPSKMEDGTLKRLMEDYTKSMESYIGNYCQATTNVFTQTSTDIYDDIFESDHLDPLENEDIEFQELDDQGRIIEKPEADELYDQTDKHDNPLVESDDKYIGMKIPMKHHASGELKEAVIKGRKRNSDGSLAGTAHPNPVLDTRIYEVEFPDGSMDEYAANLIIENLYNHVDDNGKSHSLLDSVIDHQVDEKVAISIKDGNYTNSHGVKRKCITTKGWKLKVLWKDGTESWIPLKDIKESNPIEVAEYAVAHCIDKEPAFAWWVSYTLNKRNCIIKAVRHKVWKNMRFGVPVPSSVEEALKHDKANGNTLWHDAIEKELKNVRVAFQLLQDGESPPPGSKEIPYHIVLDVKFDLTRKARLVAGGHRHKDVTSYDTYSSVVSRDSVRILLTIAALNGLNVLAADIGNAYLNAPNKEKVHCICGSELFGPSNKGKSCIIVRALYGLRSAGNSWRHHFSSYICDELGYEMTKADNDVYRKPIIKSNGEKCYSYLVVYVDDVLCIDDDPNIIMNRINGDFRLKNGVELPNMYLGTDVRTWKCADDDGAEYECWALGSESYLKEAVRTCERLMKEYDLSFTSTRKFGRKTPFSNQDYRPELDSTHFCNSDLHTVYQNLIRILHWLCELGRIDILHETSILSQYLAQPRIGHLQQVLNIFYYLKHHSRSWMPLDPTSFDINWAPKRDNIIHPEERAIAMKQLYPDAVDQLPHDMPEARGVGVDINIFVDADHAGNRVTRRSHTGIIFFLNMSPILWYSKKQNTVETSTFGSEFIALRIAMEMLDALLYKLRMFGAPINGAARVFCDNESVVTSSSTPESTLKKKHCSIAYHRVRESVAAGKAIIYHESTNSNIADLLTKPLSASVRERLIDTVLC